MNVGTKNSLSSYLMSTGTMLPSMSLFARCLDAFSPPQDGSNLRHFFFLPLLGPGRFIVATRTRMGGRLRFSIVSEMGSGSRWTLLLGFWPGFLRSVPPRLLGYIPMVSHESGPKTTTTTDGQPPLNISSPIACLPESSGVSEERHALL